MIAAADGAVPVVDGALCEDVVGPGGGGREEGAAAVGAGFARCRREGALAAFAVAFLVGHRGCDGKERSSVNKMDARFKFGGGASWPLNK